MSLLAPIILIITVGVAGCFPPSSGGSGGSPLVSVLPFVLIFILFYFLILRPQQKQSRQREEMLNSLKRGDEVLTSGGIYGRIINIADDVVTLEIAKGINIKVAKSAITAVLGKKGKNDQGTKGGK